MEWITNLRNAHGPDPRGWPQVGCGANFRPFKHGPSMVVELRTGPGKDDWTAFVSERIPTELDNAIKQKHADFYLAARDMSPEELKDITPMNSL